MLIENSKDFKFADIWVVVLPVLIRLITIKIVFNKLLKQNVKKIVTVGVFMSNRTF